MIEIEHVSYTYPGARQPVLRALSLTVDEGEFLLVCGPSGAGKSTFLRLLNGLVPHFHGGRMSGDVRAWGRSTRTHQPRDMADLVGFVFQDPEAQFVVDVVEDEIVFAMENLGVAPRIMRRRVEEVLDQLGIAHLRRRQVSSLSGGERQRVAIAAVLAAQPRALVLDEPTSQLDPHAAEEVLTALQKLNADLGLTIVLSEHRLERVVQYVDRILYFPGNTNMTPDKVTRWRGDKVTEVGDRHPVTLSPRHLIIGPPRDVLAQIELAPPLVALAKARSWSPLPLTIKEARRFANREPPSGETPAGSSENREPGDERQETSDKRRATRDKRQSQSAIDNGPRTTDHGPSIEIRRVHFSYGEHEALYDLSLAVWPGEMLALMGRNGSGKTTLLKLIVGLLRPQRGSITAVGRDVTSTTVEDLATLVGYVPQDPRALLFHDTLREELEFTLKQRRLEIGDRRLPRSQSPISNLQSPAATSDVAATLELLGLSQLAETYPRDLSGGEAQRAALATIMVGGPAVLLLDEPTRGLDYRAKAALGRLLRQLAADGRTVIVATHDVELVAAYADRVALLGDGELVVDGPVREVLSDSLIFSSQVAKLFPGTGWLTVEDARRGLGTG